MITEDLKGNLWIASKQGLLKWSPRTRKLKQFKEQLKLRAGIEYINALQVDSNGLIWVGGTGHSLAVVADSPEFLLDSFSASEPYKLSDEMVWTILADDEMLWLGTDSGVIAVNRKTQQTKTAVPRGMEVNDSIYKIDNLDSEHLLLSSTNGLFVMNKQTLEGQPLGEWSGSGQSLSHKTVLNTLHEAISGGLQPAMVSMSGTRSRAASIRGICPAPNTAAVIRLFIAFTATAANVCGSVATSRSVIWSRAAVFARWRQYLMTCRICPR